MATIYDFSANRLNSELEALSTYKGKAVLVVNTASKCGFTPQFEGLETLYKSFQSRGLEILGFPCNQFMKQDPGSAEEIADFCQANYGVTFPMFAKVDVKGESAHPLFQYLTSSAPGLLGSKAIKWNFTKFLVNSEGSVVKRYAPATKPENIAADIEALLG